MNTSFKDLAGIKAPRVEVGAIEHPTVHARSAFPLPMLEEEGIKVTFQKEEKKREEVKEDKRKKNNKAFIKAVSCTCKSFMCEQCRAVKGINIRNALLEKSGTFKIPRLYTITVNRAWFPSPKKAFEYVMDEKFIARLLTKELKVRRWVWVLEFQEENGDGWPHWHILIDISDLPGMWYNRILKKASRKEPENKKGWRYIPHFFDLNRVHRLLRKWKIGEQCKLSLKKRKFMSPAHAINYITKYLIKMPERGFPEWALKHSGIRFYQPSHDVGSILSDGVKKPRKEPEFERKKRTIRFPVERIAECRKRIFFIQYDKTIDRHVFTVPEWGLKESMALFDGAVCVQDFDFKKQKAFPVWGFRNEGEMLRYCEIYFRPELAKMIIEKVEEKKLSLLNRWNNYKPSESGEKTRGSSEAETPRDTTESPKEISFLPPPSFDMRTLAKTEAEAAGLRESACA